MKFLNFAFFFLLLQAFSILNKAIAQFDFDCGVPDEKSQTKIVNGKVALDNAWPWMVAIYMDSFICGDSIIVPDLIITAAHCVDDEVFFSYEFVYGTNKISSYNFQGETASKIYIHPDYFSSQGIEHFKISGFSKGSDEKLAIQLLDKDRNKMRKL
ncbi:unnamed protein product [Brachionus calyciflorus]|uniref:Peptidase S1 domain-containing protein n=1 Tax=Brachionus calyciflorus TaxID=104777 RepID=A0A814FBL0_9BILA|nr:unnamed protein product [Brachionus calyciflorus]